MKNLRVLMLVSLALGLGWAVRGSFGHEHGAAWAGSIGALAVIAASSRRDWRLRWPALASLAAIGWGIGGMMSYGILVGYGRGSDPLNVAYGLLALVVVGALYGFMGGGLFGLGLETAPGKRPDWPRLLSEMFVGGWLAWGLLIYQFEWLMTPPRSELWAACLGAAGAMAWYQWRNGFRSSLVVAGTSALGAGFGFGFGNVIQTLGALTGVGINWWNVMEFSLGAFGGLGMAWGVFARTWPESEDPGPGSRRLGWLFLFLVLPAINLIQALEWQDLYLLAERADLASPRGAVVIHLTAGWVLVAMTAVGGALVLRSGARTDSRADRSDVRAALLLSGAVFIALAVLRSGLFLGATTLRPEQAAYVVALGGIWFFARRKSSEVAGALLPGAELSRVRFWLAAGVALVLVMVLFALVLTGLHDGLPGQQVRF